MRRLASYVGRYGPEVGPKLYATLQSQAGHASVGARLRKKLAGIRERGERPLPLFEGLNEPGQDLNRVADPLEPPASR